MPIRVANDIPAKNQLTEEGIIFMEETHPYKSMLNFLW